MDVPETSSEVQVHHATERPEDWGWHAEMGRGARVSGWVVAIILLLLMTTTHYNGMGFVALGAGAAGIIVILLWDRARRRNAWRS